MAINPWLQAAGAAATSAPARSVYGSILRSARIPTTGQQFPIRLPSGYTRAGSAVDSNVTYEGDIPQEFPAPENSAEVEAALERLRRGERPAPETPARATSANGSPAPGSQRDGESQETFDALREFQANLRARHMTTEPQQQQLSVLDMLRKRMANAMENEQARRISDLGTALLASRSPNFLTALGEGFAAQEAGSRSRMDQLRQIADLERQQRALDIEEARRQEELRIREDELRQMGPYRTALTEQALASAAAQRAGRAGPTNAAALRRATQAGDSALNAAIRAAAAESPPRTLSPDAQEEIWQRAYQRSIQGQGATAPAGAPSAPATTTQDIPTITPGGRPAR